MNVIHFKLIFKIHVLIFVEPACGERDIVVTFSVHCMCMPCVCVCVCVYAGMFLSRFVQAITSAFMHDFQNYLAQLFSFED